ncbi:MAG: phospho-N-acetylmuramoyl-pentapeptide-transferase [Pirellulales bacterium]
MLETLLEPFRLAGGDSLAPWPVWARAAAATLVALLAVKIAGPTVVAWLARHCREPIRSASPQLNTLMASKQGTPTLGGLLVLAGWLAGALCFTRVNEPGVIFCLACVLALAAIGLVDDLTKLRTSRRGLSARAKLISQVLLLSGPVCWISASEYDGASAILVALLVMSVLVAAANAVNLSDGLDGLAAGSLLPVLVALAAIGLSGATIHRSLTASSTQSLWNTVALAPLSGSATAASELVILAAALAGALAGFLPLNVQPARVFLGNTGSLALGGALGALGVLLLPLWTLAVVSGVFVVEAASVIVQVAAFQTTGRRVFRCAPLHHHFQFLGWSERRIVRTFWGVSLAFVLTASALASGHYQIVNNRGELDANPTLATTKHHEVAGHDAPSSSDWQKQ